MSSSIDALLDSSARDIAAAVRAREVSAVEITTASLARADRLGPVVGAFVRVTPELALEQASRVDERVAAVRRNGYDGVAADGESVHVPAADADRLLAALRPLAGVPCPIKDLNQVAGVPMSVGAALLAAHPIVPDADDGTVTLLREAGTTMIGKTATPEFGFPPYTEPRTGPGGEIVAARTPWDLTRGAGGSSGGAAAAVAAGIAPIAHASDGGGSVRIPAASCGLVGFKPSRGRVSNGPLGVDGNGLATQGVITRSVLDAALALDVLCRAWPGEVVPSLDQRGLLPLLEYAELADPDYGGRLDAVALGLRQRRLRLGILTEPVVAGDAVVHPQARAAAERAAGVLEGLGLSVEPAPVPFTPQEWMAFMPLWSVGALTLPVPDEAEPMLEPLTRWLREIGRGVTGAQYATAVAEAQRVARATARAWDSFDAVITPSLAGPPAPVGAIRNDADPARDFEDQKRFTPWTSIANICGRPSVSVPILRAAVEDGGVELPFGAMLTGRIGGDPTVLELARLLELADPWPAPPVPAVPVA